MPVPSTFLYMPSRVLSTKILLKEKKEMVSSSSPPHPSPLTPHPSPLTPHPSPLTPHPSPLTPHPSPLTPHPSPLTPHPSPLTPHPSPLTPYIPLLFRKIESTFLPPCSSCTKTSVLQVDHLPFSLDVVLYVLSWSS